ncbi:MAG: septum formation protein Maf [Deltaproteobacteria bacterium]|nr:septum formation protein Maf [Deltaproteobacteria bacterium]
MVLASQSPRRIRMFEEQRIAVRIIPADIEEEQLPEESPVDFVRRMCGEKAMTVAAALSRAGETPFVVAADTIVVLNRQILGKPTDRAHAKAMLQQLSGNSHTVITGWTIGKMGEAWTVSHCETRVTFHALSEAEIDAYIATGDADDKAGAYAIQGLGGYLVSEVAGDFYNVVGLPISQVVRSLIQRGALKGFLHE